MKGGEHSIIGSWRKEAAIFARTGMSNAPAGAEKKNAGKRNSRLTQQINLAATGDEKGRLPHERTSVKFRFQPLRDCPYHSAAEIVDAGNVESNPKG